MLFCTNCGNQVTPNATFCSHCGTRQGTTPIPKADPLGSISSRTASMLCYIPVVGWIAAIFVLASPRFLHERQVRFHAFQGIYLFVAWLLVEWVVQPFFYAAPGPGEHVMNSILWLLQLVIFGGWVFMIVKTAQEQCVRLPIVGELAERSVAEQR